MSIRASYLYTDRKLIAFELITALHAEVRIIGGIVAKLLHTHVLFNDLLN